ncbi:hypothetical protein MJD09_08475, partial [bacterium]|nr:hypothetical protein [bacterium]
EVKLADVGENFDFVSTRGGVQFFQSDFNGLVFQDFNLGGQLFGELSKNRYQWSAAYLNLLQKENGLLTFESQDQQVFFANWFVEDFLKPGFNTVFSFHYNRDRQSNAFATELDVIYIGLASAGHWGRIEFSPAVYFAFGNQDIEGNRLDVSAYLAGVEFAYPKDYMNYRAAFFVASGDSDPFDDKATGFDSINDNINLFGAGNSFVIGGSQFGTRANSFIPSIRPTATQANFINPGILLANAGLDVTLTPKMFFTSNFNYFQFMQTESIVVDSKSLGFELNGAINHRLFLNENLVFQLGMNAFFPQNGAKQILGSDDIIFTGNVALVTLF